MIEENKKYGVKVTIINSMDYTDFHEIISSIQSKGYKVTMIDNGNAVCEK